jgi:2-alkyl-3-oxoalkanoate reductase
LLTIFLTGASGFIGQALLKKLLARQFRLICYVRSTESRNRIEALGGIAWQFELDKLKDLESQLKQCDVVIHAAGLLELGSAPAEFASANIELTRILLKAAQVAAVKKFIYLSAASVVMHGPQDLLNLDETAPLTQRAELPYSFSKARAEELVLSAASTSFQTMALRPAFVWGPNDAIERIIGPAIKTGKFAWFDHGSYLFSTCYVGNLCAAVLLAINHEGVGQAFYISDGEPVIFKEFMLARLQAGAFQAPKWSLPKSLAWALAHFAETGWAYLPLVGKPPLVREMVRLMGYAFTLNITAARRQLNYVPPYSIADGMAEIKVSLENRSTDSSTATST